MRFRQHALELNHNMLNGSIIERPKVVRYKKKFYMFFHHELAGKGYSSALIGVAISNKPLGPFDYKKSFRINPGKLPINEKDLDTVPKNKFFKRDFNIGQMSRDIGVLVDNGNIYIFSSSESNATIIVSKFDPDSLSLNGEFSRIAPLVYNEAPVPFKKGGFYYLITSGTTGWKPNQAKLYKSKNIYLGWENVGTIVKSNKGNVETTFDSQSAFIFTYKKELILCLDKWNEQKLNASTYIFKPIKWNGEQPFID